MLRRARARHDFCSRAAALASWTSRCALARATSSSSSDTLIRSSCDGCGVLVSRARTGAAPSWRSRSSCSRVSSRSSCPCSCLHRASCACHACTNWRGTAGELLPPGGKLDERLAAEAAAAARGGSLAMGTTSKSGVLEERWTLRLAPPAPVRREADAASCGDGGPPLAASGLLIMEAELLALDRVSPGAALPDDPVASSC
mmetsp:Transcript_37369/g.94779  ORF Transcript_37369/g.94779 Transcript_37369/m.94779 type:complete len:201 (-) Transcript_37369:196-798(-)